MVNPGDSGEISYFTSFEEALALARTYYLSGTKYRLREWIVESQSYHLVITGDNLHLFDGP